MWSKHLVNLSTSEKRLEIRRVQKTTSFSHLDLGNEASTRPLGELRTCLLDLGSPRRPVIDSRLRNPEKVQKWLVTLVAKWNTWWLRRDWLALPKFLVVKDAHFPRTVSQRWRGGCLKSCLRGPPGGEGTTEERCPRVRELSVTTQKRDTFACI